MIKYYSEEELQIRIREIRDSKEYLTKREDELIAMWSAIQGTGRAITGNGVVYENGRPAKKPAKEKKKREIEVASFLKAQETERMVELLDEVVDREAAER